MIKQKILAFCLKHWKELVIVLCLSTIAFKTHMDYRTLSKTYEISKQEMEIQITSLRDIHAQEIQKREEALEDYKEALEEIQRSHAEAQEQLELEKIKKKSAYLRQFSQDKEGLANEIINAYGFELVE